MQTPFNIWLDLADGAFRIDVKRSGLTVTLEHQDRTVSTPVTYTELKDVIEVLTLAYTRAGSVVNVKTET